MLAKWLAASDKLFNERAAQNRRTIRRSTLQNNLIGMAFHIGAVRPAPADFRAGITMP